MSITLRFIDPHGDIHEVEAEPGDNLLRVGQAAGMSLEGTCEGQMACSTCHVYVHPDWVEKLPAKEDMEEDMLDFAYEPDTTRSRLTCQIKVSDALDGLVVQMPEKQI